MTTETAFEQVLDLSKQQQVSIKIRTNNTDLIPHYASTGAAGADIKANLEADVTIAPGSTAVIPTGLFFEIPEGFEVQIRPRSGFAFKNQVTVLNSPGTIDSDYRGELKVLLINLGKCDFTISHLMRIAQCIVAPVVRASFTLSEELSSSIRGSGGFGHTGTHTVTGSDVPLT